jgi:hypothetical protein
MYVGSVMFSSATSGRHFVTVFDGPPPDGVARVVGGIREKASGQDLSCLDQPITENELFLNTADSKQYRSNFLPPRQFL